MKSFCILTLFALLVSAQTSDAQTSESPVKLLPSDGLLGNQEIGKEKTVATWYVWADTVKKELAEITTTIEPNYKGNQVLVIQNIAMKGASGMWVDTTIAMQKTLAPVYHASYNGQREMAIRFNAETAVGYYRNKKDGVVTNIDDKMNEPYFDSNMYPQMIRFLPLAAGYTAMIPIYDFNQQKHGILYAHITEVKETTIPDEKGVATASFAVRIKDEISPGAESVHYITKQGRKLIRSEIVIGSRKMTIEMR